MPRPLASVLFAACSLVLIAAPLVALPHQPPEIEGVVAFREAENLVYAETGDSPTIERALDRARRGFAREADPALRAYWTARVHLLLGTHYNRLERSRPAERELDDGFDAIARALEASGPFSEGYRVMSDLHSQMMMAKGVIYMMRNGSEARDLALEALEMDPSNVNARATVGAFYLNAPAFAGGDPAQALPILEAALDLEARSEGERFVLLVMLTQTAAALENGEATERYYTMARSVFPDARWIRDNRDLLQ